MHNVLVAVRSFWSGFWASFFTQNTNILGFRVKVHSSHKHLEFMVKVHSSHKRLGFRVGLHSSHKHLGFRVGFHSAHKTARV